MPVHVGSGFCRSRLEATARAAAWCVLGALISLGCDSGANEPAAERVREEVRGDVLEEAHEEEVWWPDDEAAARELISSETHEVGNARALDADTLTRAIDRAARSDRLVVGWGPIAEALAPYRVIVFGVKHDARAQHAAFRRLFGPLRPARSLVLEVFDADGDWRGLDDGSRRGDDDALARYLGGGEESALAELRGRLARGAYTAWKYAYVDEVIALLVAARGLGREVRGCDAPPPLQARMEGWVEESRLRMRELHCARAIERVEGDVAVLIGDAHALPEGLPRFVPDAASVHVVGGRESDAGVEPALAEHIRVVDPVLVPLDARGYALLLPGPHLGAAIVRSRVRERQPGLRLDDGIEAWVDGERAGGALDAGDHAIVIDAAERRWILGLTSEAGDGARLRVDASGIDLRLYAERSAPPGSER